MTRNKGGARLHIFILLYKGINGSVTDFNYYCILKHKTHLKYDKDVYYLSKQKCLSVMLNRIYDLVFPLLLKQNCAQNHFQMFRIYNRQLRFLRNQDIILLLLFFYTHLLDRIFSCSLNTGAFRTGLPQYSNFSGNT